MQQFYSTYFSLKATEAKLEGCNDADNGKNKSSLKAPTALTRFVQKWINDSPQLADKSDRFLYLRMCGWFILFLVNGLLFVELQADSISNFSMKWVTQVRSAVSPGLLSSVSVREQQACILRRGSSSFLLTGCAFFSRLLQQGSFCLRGLGAAGVLGITTAPLALSVSS